MTDFNNHVTADPLYAAARLAAGDAIDWQPGTGGRYECLLIQYGLGYDGVGEAITRKALVVYNLGLTIKLSSAWNVSWWVRDPQGGLDHHGIWQSLRPLLTALGYGSGSLNIQLHDQVDEDEARATQPASQRYERDDADLGRSVRLLVASRESIASRKAGALDA